MNEQWKRLIEAERRLARLESTLQRTNNAITGVRGSLRNDSQNATPIFGGGGGTGGGGTGVHRFPTEFRMRVEWDVVPSLSSSFNPAADGPSLAEAVSALEAGFTLNTSNDIEYFYNFLFDRASEQTALYTALKFSRPIVIGGRTQVWNAITRFAYYDDDTYMADPRSVAYSGQLFEGDIGPETTGTTTSRLNISWPRRGGGSGAWIGDALLEARRTVASESQFDYGPKFGESGFWAFDMVCPVTSYSTAGSGTIYLEWGSGTGEMAIVSGGTPDSLPADIISGGTPASLPSDIIDGGVI